MMKRLRSGKKSKGASSSSQPQPPPPPPSSHPPPPRLTGKIAEFRYSLFKEKKVIPDKTVVFVDFNEYDLLEFFEPFGLVNLLQIDEKVYPSLVIQFYSNLELRDDTYYSRVGNRTIKFTASQFANIFQLFDFGVEILTNDVNQTLRSFEHYEEDESPINASTLLHGNDNPAFIDNEEVKHFTFRSQLIVKMILHTVLPKTGEFSHARGCAPLLTYCLLTSTQVHIPHLMLETMLSSHLLIPYRCLPYGMYLTHLFKYFDVDLTNEIFEESGVRFDNSVLTRMRSHLARRPTPAPVPPVETPVASPRASSARDVPPSFSDSLSALTNSVRDISLRLGTIENNQHYIIAHGRYQEAMADQFYSHYGFTHPVPTPWARPYPQAGPPFDPWAAPSDYPGGSSSRPMETDPCFTVDDPDDQDDPAD